ncbi:MAG: hypothetical protein P8R54_13325 [Myxococcota bacterium]|nr:hypothetical protein [Myxococcota bacterium]
MATPIAMLLHMHQPDYRHPVTGVPVMPWVRLHASRGYTDVPVLLAETGAQATVNVVPSLLEQLAYYAEGGSDAWEEHSRIPAEVLTDAQRGFIRAQFFHGHPAMRQVSRRYQELEHRVGAQVPLSDQDYRDIQVWSNLAWIGAVGRRDARIQAAIAHDAGFSQAQLLEVLAVQRSLVAGVLGHWRKLHSVSCTPYCHPILPLLVDFKHAHRCLDIPDEVDFAWPHDALRQLTDARKMVAEVLQHDALGLWPSEGAVSPEVAVLAGRAGFTWLVTDQAIMERSDRDAPPRIDRPWRIQDGPVGLFRDRELSDVISFHYAKWRGGDAAADLIKRVDARYSEGVCVLALDGENPWESYPDAGESFMRALFSSGRMVSMETAAARKPAGTITRIHTGSWIGGDLAVWAGDSEDRRAWKLLSAARQAWEAAGCPESAWRHLAAAEGSDWFWWFGPEHHSEVHELFDALFREHVAAIWRAIGQPVPPELAVPVSAPGGAF